MNRQPNLTDSYLRGYNKRLFHNPLFNLLSTEFDNAFKDFNISDEYFITQLYVDHWLDKSVTNQDLMRRFTLPPKRIVQVGDIASEFDQRPGLTYFLLGKKGMGKTSFLMHFYYQMKKLRKFSSPAGEIPVYLDLRDKKSDDKFIRALPSSLLSLIFDTLRNADEYPEISQYLTEPEKIRLIDRSYAHIASDDLLISRVLNHPQEAVGFLFRWAKRQDLGLTVIIDNIDDYDVVRIKSIMGKCQELKNKYSARCIVALRDYWHPRALGVDDSQYCACDLGEPDIFEILKRRLNSIRTDAIKKKIVFAYGRHEPIEFDANDAILTFEGVVKDLTECDRSLHEDLYQLTNYNTREHLHNISHFFHSPYLFSMPNFISELIRKVRSQNPDVVIEDHRRVQFFDFLQSFMAVHYLHYDPRSSEIFNVFFHPYDHDTGYDYRNTLIYPRLLQFFPTTGSQMNKKMVIQHFTCAGYPKKAVLDAMNELLHQALLESHEGIDIARVHNLSISQKGLFYLERMIPEYTYLLFVSDAVPMEEDSRVSPIDKFGDELVPLGRGNLTAKIEAVNKFVRFIDKEENDEFAMCAASKKSVIRRIRGTETLSSIMGRSIFNTIEKMMHPEKRPTYDRIHSVRVLEDGGTREIPKEGT